MDEFGERDQSGRIFFAEPLNAALKRPTQDLNATEPLKIFADHCMPGLITDTLHAAEEMLPIRTIPAYGYDENKPVLSYTIGAFARYPTVSTGVRQFYRRNFSLYVWDSPLRNMHGLPQPNDFDISTALINGSFDLDTYFIVPDTADIESGLSSLSRNITAIPWYRHWDSQDNLREFMHRNKDDPLLHTTDVFIFENRGYALRHHFKSERDGLFRFTHDLVFMRGSAILDKDMRLGPQHGKNQRLAKRILRNPDGSYLMLSHAFEPAFLFPESIEHPHYTSLKQALVSALRVIKPVVKNIPSISEGSLWPPLDKLIEPESIEQFRAELRRLMNQDQDVPPNSFYDNEIVLHWMDMATQDFDTSVRLGCALGIIGGLVAPQQELLTPDYPWQEERFAKQIIEHAHTLIPLMQSGSFTYRQLFDLAYLDRDTVGPLLLLRSLKNLGCLDQHIWPDVHGVIELFDYSARRRLAEVVQSP